MKIFIAGHVPSSKNSMRVGNKCLFYSKPVRRYLAATAKEWKEHATAFRQLYDSLPKPVSVELKFIRGSRHRFDYINACQIIADLMVKNGWVEDDNADCFTPIFLPYEYNKENAGVFIELKEKQTKEEPPSKSSKDDLYYELRDLYEQFDTDSTFEEWLKT